MSLINNVLRDLDRRQAAASERVGVPREVRPLPVAARPAWIVPVAITVIVGMLGGLALFWPASVPPAKPTVPVVQAPPEVKVSEAAVVKPEANSAVPSAPTFRDSTAPVQVLARPAAKSDTASVQKRADPPAVEKGVSLPRGKVVYPHDPGLRLDAKLASRKTTDPANESTDEVERAQNLIRLGRSAEAEPLLRQTLQAQPGNLVARQALLGILLPSRRFNEAAPVLREGLTQNPEQLPWAMNLARLQVETNDYAAAWETLNRSMSHAQQNADFLAFAGTVLQRINRHSEALMHYEAALRLRPQEARWWVGYGIALESAGRSRDAGEAFNRARNLGGLSTEIQSYLDEKLK